MKKQPQLVIEHCEPILSEWLLLEYKHAAKLWGENLIFTRVANNKTARVLQKLGTVQKKRQKIYSQAENVLFSIPKLRNLSHQMIVYGVMQSLSVGYSATKNLRVGQKK
jgi:ribosome biogenesis SPOUT family RNA methylase Rps3